MQSFIKQDRIEPKKENVLVRLKNFKEIYEVFDIRKSGNQAERCVQCGDPYCSAIGCPLGNFIPHWLKLIAEKDLELAFKISNETSPFPEILGKICPHDKLCEGACTLHNDGFGAITIGSIETAITQNAFDAGFEPEFPGIKTDKKVAVIGSGPAGMGAATYLLRAGIEVHMFEKDTRAGGLLTFGIPGFKLDKSTVSKRFSFLQKAGLKLNLGVEIGKDISMETLEKGYDAIFVAVGTRASNSADIEGEDRPNVITAMDFLTSVQKKLFGEVADSKYDVRGKNVVVIGGGDTAMDCLRTALREGARTSTCLYRRDKASMPGSKKEYINAKDEGVEFVFNKSPKEFALDQNGLVKSVITLNTHIHKSKTNSRGKLKVVEGTECSIDADFVILSLGFVQQDLSFLGDSVEKSSKGTIIVDNLKTTNPKVYAGGDCIRGADLAVTAARDGREAAKRIIKDIL